MRKKDNNRAFSGRVVDWTGTFAEIMLPKGKDKGFVRLIMDRKNHEI